MQTNDAAVYQPPDIPLSSLNPESEEILSPKNIARIVYASIRRCATTLRPDIAHAVNVALNEINSTDKNEHRATTVLSQILENAEIAACDEVPLCQDTGTVWICLEVGEKLCLPANIFSLVDDAVAQAYQDGHLRMSVVHNALFDRSNTQNNTPAFCEIKPVPGAGAKLHVLLKGGGSDNSSRIVMLTPDEGIQGVTQVVLNTVKEKASGACPPLLIGVGVGSTFDRVACLSKHALLRNIGSPAQNEQTAELETAILDAVNATGIGPAALGGYPTALAVHIESAPCHIAALPIAVNMGCCAMRSETTTLLEDNENDET